MATDRATRARMGAAARAHVLTRFTTARVAADFMTCYDRLLGPAGTG